MTKEELPGFDALKEYRAEIDRRGTALAAARRRVELTTDALRATVCAAVEHGMTQSEAARLAGVRRQTVIDWLAGGTK